MQNAFEPNANIKKVVSVTEDGTVKLWSVATGQRLDECVEFAAASVKHAQRRANAETKHTEQVLRFVGGERSGVARAAETRYIKTMHVAETLGQPESLSTFDAQSNPRSASQSCSARRVTCDSRGAKLETTWSDSILAAARASRRNRCTASPCVAGIDRSALEFEVVHKRVGGWSGVGEGKRIDAECRLARVGAQRRRGQHDCTATQAKLPEDLSKLSPAALVRGLCIRLHVGAQLLQEVVGTERTEELVLCLQQDVHLILARAQLLNG